MVTSALVRLAAAWRSRGRRVLEVPAGVGLEFDDGCDVWWVLPGEPLSSTPVDSADNVDVDAILAVADRINVTRARVIHGLRQYAASRGYHLMRNPSGSWGIESSKGFSSSLSVGALLTVTAAAEDDPHRVLTRILEGSILRAPSRKLFERHLAATGEPPELPARAEPPPLLPTNLLGTLSMMGLCRALEKGDEVLADAKALVAAAQPKGRIGEALLRVAARLPHVEAEVGITDSSIALEFADGYDAYHISPTSRELVALVRQRGPEGAGDWLADEYTSLNEARRTAIESLKAALADGGFRIEIGSHLPDLEESIHFGIQQREGALPLRRTLTQAVREHGAAGALRELLRGHAIADAAARIAEAGPPPRPVAITSGRLPPAPPEPYALPRLEEFDHAAVDRIARQVLSELLATGRDAAYLFGTALYDPQRDHWATAADWLRIARAMNDSEYPDITAIWILSHFGDASREDELLEALGEAEPHDEVSLAEVGIIWRHRHSRPELARRWFAPSLHDEVPCAYYRAGLGDPIAVRNQFAEMHGGVKWETLGRLRPELVRGFASEETIESWHAEALQWAKETWLWQFGASDDVLSAATVMGWADVGEAMEENPFLLPGLFDSERPGIVHSGRMIAEWSRLRPSPFLARLAAHLLTTDLAALAEPEAEALIGKEPQLLHNLVTDLTTEMQRAAAVAWFRCRTG